MKLKPKILSLLLPLTIIPLIGYVFLSYTYLTGHTQKSQITHIQFLLDQVEVDLITRLNSNEAIAHITANNPHVLSALINPKEENLDNLSNSFKNHINMNQDLFVMALIDESGTLIYEHPSKQSLRLDYATYTTSAYESDSMLYSEVSAEANSQKVTNVLVRKLKTPVKSDDGNITWIRGYLVMSFDLTSLQEMTRLSKTNDIGIVLYTNAEGKSYFPQLNPALAGFDQAVMKAVKSRLRAVRQYNVQDEQFHAGFKRVRENLYIVTISPEGGQTLLVNNLRRYSLWYIVGIALIAILICYQYTSSVLVAPLRQLKKQVLDGQISTEFSIITSNDEIGELSTAFKEMSISLFNSQAEINKLAFYDPLTSLPNKITFDKALERGIEHSKMSHRALAVLVIDLDNFKLINDVHGHTAGDEVIKEVALRLRNCLRHIELDNDEHDSSPLYAQDMIIRNGGDEFSILLTDLFQAYQASLIAQRIIDELSLPFTINQSKLNLGASIGISLYPVDGLEPEELVKNADLAMFEAKKKGKNNFQFFTPALNASAAKRLETEHDLRIAIEENQFELYYQPIVFIPTGKIAKLEVLLRWNHPVKGIILPSKFIPVAEESGQIIQLGNLVMNRACAQLAKWHDDGHSDLKLSINLLAKQLLKGNPVETIKAAISEHGILSQFLEIEVKEDLLVKDQASSIEVLNAIKEIGVSVCLDDFGRGFASLSFLQKFPLDTIKIDRTLVRDLTGNKRIQAIIQTTCRLAKELGLSVIIEGIESESQLPLIKECNADFAQGFYYSTPLPEEELDLEKFWGTPNASSSLI